MARVTTSTVPPKATLFIGSSTESLQVARRMRTSLGRQVDVKVWEKDVFRLGDAALVSLLRVIDQFDFAVFLLAKDDLTRSRKKQENSPRDNVIFELGLFCGRLGPRRTFVVAERGVKIPSDLAGIERAVLDSRRAKAILAVSDRLSEDIGKRRGESELRLLPSTALAIGYFRNFICPLHEAISGRRQLKAIGRTWNLRANPPYLTVLIPDELGKAFPHGVASVARAKLLSEVKIRHASRNYPLYVRVRTPKGGGLELFDVPTTLASCTHAIKLYIGKQAAGVTKEERDLEMREIVNFERTLRNLLDEKENWSLREFVRLERL